MGKIEAINITNISEENTFYVNQAILEKGKGIVNDRYYENFKEKKEQVTLINLEDIDNFNKQIKQNIDAKDFRRNIIVSGIHLNELINKKIKINIMAQAQAWGIGHGLTNLTVLTPAACNFSYYQYIQ